MVDEASINAWVFLTKTKSPPIEIIDFFLNHSSLKFGTRRIRTDQGGKFALSKKFRNHVIKHTYVLETTVSNYLF